MSFEAVRLGSRTGSFLELTVTGYQFPDATVLPEGQPCDANWLMIRGEVADGDRTWDFHQPCMTTWEARDLAGWLHRLTDASSSVDPEFGFVEPNLRLELAEQTPQRIILTVWFSQESRPNRRPGNDIGGSDRITLTIPRSDIGAVAGTWERSLQEFPPR